MKEKIFLYNPNHSEHPGYRDEQEKPWDTPERAFRIVEELLIDNADSRNWNIVTELHPETLLAIEDVHSEDMIRAIGEASKAANNCIPSTTEFDIDKDIGTSDIYPGTFEESLLSAECALLGLDELLNYNTRLAIAINRPPGHHAGKNFYHGFCYFNNAAIVANQISRIRKKSAIIDFDIHHGDGTQDIVKGRDDIMYNSLHADPSVVMPHTGFPEDHNLYENINNYPLPIGISSSDYLATFEKMLERVRQFSPDYLIIDAGFDGHMDEYQDLPPLTMLQNDDYKRMGQMLKKIGVPTLVLLAGGYNQDVTPKAFSSFIDGLSDNTEQVEIVTSDKLI